VENCINVKRWLMNAHPSKSKLSSSSQLNLDKVANIYDMPKFSHQLSEILGRRILREHSVVNHRQSRSAVLDKFADLRYSILELNYSKAPPAISPEVAACPGGDFQESIHASFNSLFFSNNIQLSTYRKGKELKYLTSR
jgi:hypothetical protein